MSLRSSVEPARLALGIAAGPSFEKPWIREIHRLGESLAYYEGEPDAQE